MGHQFLKDIYRRDFVQSRPERTTEAFPGIRKTGFYVEEELGCTTGVNTSNKLGINLDAKEVNFGRGHEYLEYLLFHILLM